MFAKLPASWMALNRKRAVSIIKNTKKNWTLHVEHEGKIENVFTSSAYFHAPVTIENRAVYIKGKHIGDIDPENKKKMKLLPNIIFMFDEKHIEEIEISEFGKSQLEMYLENQDELLEHYKNKIIAVQNGKCIGEYDQDELSAYRDMKRRNIEDGDYILVFCSEKIKTTNIF